MHIPVGLNVWSLSGRASTSEIVMLGMVRGFRMVLESKNKQKVQPLQRNSLSPTHPTRAKGILLGITKQ